MALRGRGRLRGLHPSVREAANWTLDVAEYYRVPITVTSGHRDWATQTRLYRDWKRGRSKWPANPPGDSSHNFGLAWDSTTTPEYQRAWNYIRRAAGFEVLDHDIIHAQLPNWRQYV